MSIKSVFIITFLLCVCAVNIFPQKVEVTQGFVDDATRSFIELRAERDLNKAQTDQISKQNTLIERLLAQNELLINQNKLQNEQIKDLSKLKCSDWSLLDLKIIKILHFKRCK